MTGLRHTTTLRRPSAVSESTVTTRLFQPSALAGMREVGSSSHGIHSRTSGSRPRGAHCVGCGSCALLPSMRARRRVMFCRMRSPFSAVVLCLRQFGTAALRRRSHRGSIG